MYHSDPHFDAFWALDISSADEICAARFSTKTKTAKTKTTKKTV